MPINCSCDFDYGDGWIETGGLITLRLNVTCCECDDFIPATWQAEVAWHVVEGKQDRFGCTPDEIIEILYTCPVCFEIREKLGGECSTWTQLWSDLYIALDQDQITLSDLDGLSMAARERLFPIMEKVWEEQDELEALIAAEREEEEREQAA